MPEPRTHANPRLLFVDDEGPARRYFARLFGDEFEILTAGRVDEAIDILDREGASLAILVTDQRMPGGKSGTDLLEFARHRLPRVTRIFSTAYTDIDSAKTAVNRGDLFRYIEKPWDTSTLRTILREAYHHHLREEQNYRLLEERRSAMLSLAAGIAHEMSTPLASIHLSMSGLLNSLPRLLEGYRTATAHGLIENPLPQRILRGLDTTPTRVKTEVEQANMIINAMLLAVHDGANFTEDTSVLPIRACLEAAIARFPFNNTQRGLVQLDIARDFNFEGREELMVYVIYNLLRNALYALATREISGRGRGHITISVPVDNDHHAPPRVIVRDTGTGIPTKVVPHIFEDYYTTRPSGVGNGLGLPFCRRVMRSMGGDIAVATQDGEYTEMTLSFIETPATTPTPTSDKSAIGGA